MRNHRRSTRLVLGAWLAPLVLVGMPALGHAESVGTLTLDGLSFVSFQDEQILSLPSGSQLRFHFADPGSDGTVQFRIEPSGVEIPPIDVDADRTLRYGLAGTATGTMRKTEDGRRMSFQASISATPGEGQTFVYSMPFTTETTQATNAQGVTIEVTGMRLVDGVWYVQLVGATVNEKNAYPRPGATVYTILSGSFDQLPEL